MNNFVEFSMDERKSLIIHKGLLTKKIYIRAAILPFSWTVIRVLKSLVKKNVNYFCGLFVYMLIVDIGKARSRPKSTAVIAYLGQ